MIDCSVTKIMDKMTSKFKNNDECSDVENENLNLGDLNSCSWNEQYAVHVEGTESEMNSVASEGGSWPK